MIHGTASPTNAKDALAQQYKWIPQFSVALTGMDINRDNVRTPMQWTGEGRNAGFTEEHVEAWNEIQDSQEKHCRNVEAQQEDKNSLLWTYKTLLRLRQRSPALHSGDISLLETHDNNRHILAYMRRHSEADDHLMYFNFDSRPAELDLSHELHKGEVEVAFSIGDFDLDFENKTVSLGKYAGLIIKTSHKSCRQMNVTSRKSMDTCVTC